MKVTAVFGGHSVRAASLGTLLGALAALAVACGGEPAPTAEPTPVVTPAAASATTPTPVATHAAAPATTPTPVATPAAAPAPTPPFVPAPVILPTVAMPMRTPTPEPTGSLAETLDEVERRTSEIREIFAFQELDREFITKDELRLRLIDDFEEDRDEVLKTQGLYAALGILDEDADLLDILVQLYAETVLGFFDLDEEKIYVVDDISDFSPGDVLTYAHEYTHGLQQRNFQIRAAFDALEDADADRSLAFRALTEGDASMVQLIYMSQHMSAQEQEEIRQSPAEPSEGFRNAPRVVQRRVVFPYSEGSQFVLTLLLETNGWELVNRAFEMPPLSTEHILHPEKYLAYEEPVEVELDGAREALGDDWLEIDRDTLGELTLLAYLEMTLAPEEAAVAAAGWGGDRYVLLENAEGESLLVLKVAWDSEADANEFFDAFQALIGARSDGEWRAVEGGDSTTVIDLANRGILISLDSMYTRMIFAPDARALEAARTALAGLW